MQSNNLQEIFKILDNPQQLDAKNAAQAPAATANAADAVESLASDSSSAADTSLKTNAVAQESTPPLRPGFTAEVQAELRSLIDPHFVQPEVPLDPKEIAKLPEFVCDSCGLCCSRVDISPYLAPLESERKDGYCRYFDVATKLCTIYEQRPIICNIKEGYLALFKDVMSWEQFYLENAKACAQLKQLHVQNKYLKEIKKQDV